MSGDPGEKVSETRLPVAPALGHDEWTGEVRPGIGEVSAGWIGLGP